MASAVESLQLSLYSYCEFSRKNTGINKELHVVLVDLAITCHAQKNTKLSRKRSEDCENVKYLGSLFYANGGAEKDVNNRVKIAWSNWRETTGGDVRQEHTNKVERQCTIRL